MLFRHSVVTAWWNGDVTWRCFLSLWVMVEASAARPRTAHSANAYLLIAALPGIIA